MNVAEYIFDFLKDKTEVVFTVVGGHAMYLNNALLHSGIRYVCTHHEQAAGMAAEAYGRLTGKIGVALVTAGPGAANVLNGVIGGYMDSSPMMIISGQSPLRFVKYMKKTQIRQNGVQGILIEPIVRPMVKDFETLDSGMVRQKINRLYKTALSGRPGPVWLDVPLDIQNEKVS